MSDHFGTLCIKVLKYDDDWKVERCHLKRSVQKAWKDLDLTH